MKKNNKKMLQFHQKNNRIMAIIFILLRGVLWQLQTKKSELNVQKC
jgi:hypothetical protein